MTIQESKFGPVKEETRDQQQNPVHEFNFVTVKEERREEQKTTVEQPQLAVIKQEPEDEQHLQVQEFLSVELNVEDGKRIGLEDLHPTRAAANTAQSVQGGAANRNSYWQEPETSSNRPNAGKVSAHRRQRDTDGNGTQPGTASQTLKCGVCSAVFMSKYSLVRHVFSHIDGIPVPDNVCHLCGDVYTKSDVLAQHIIICEGFQAKCKCDGEGDSCGFCQKSLEHSLNLERRLNHSATIEYKSSAIGKSSPQQDCVLAQMTVQKRERLWKCDVCSNAFTSRKRLENHKCVPAGTKPYTCTTCRKNFTHVQNLNRHKLIHTGERPHICSICGKGFTQAQNLQRHTLVHTREKKYICEICGIAYSRPEYLQAHKFAHTGEKPHKCGTCSMAFSNPYHLRCHERTHTGEKPFKCEICGKSFSQIQNMQRHRMVHTKEKKYKCGNCEKSFSKSKSLQNHRCVNMEENP